MSPTSPAAETGASSQPRRFEISPSSGFQTVQSRSQMRRTMAPASRSPRVEAIPAFKRSGAKTLTMRLSGAAIGGSPSNGGLYQPRGRG